MTGTKNVQISGKNGIVPPHLAKPVSITLTMLVQYPLPQHC